MNTQPIRFVARAPRSGFGRLIKWLFWLTVLVPPLLMMATCAGLQGFVMSKDVEVASGAALFGAGALGLLGVIWFVGVPVMGLFMLLTRGKLLVIEQPPPTP